MTESDLIAKRGAKTNLATRGFCRHLSIRALKHGFRSELWAVPGRARSRSFLSRLVGHLRHPSERCGHCRPTLSTASRFEGCPLLLAASSRGVVSWLDVFGVACPFWYGKQYVRASNVGPGPPWKTPRAFRKPPPHYWGWFLRARVCFQGGSRTHFGSPRFPLKLECAPHELKYSGPTLRFQGNLDESFGS